MRKIATRLVLGAICSISSTTLADSSVVKLLVPVTLPPGRPRLATRPVPTGSVTLNITIGIALAASRAAIDAAVPHETITSTFWRTSSAAILGNSPRVSADHL